MPGPKLCRQKLIKADASSRTHFSELIQRDGGMSGGKVGESLFFAARPRANSVKNYGEMNFASDPGGVLPKGASECVAGDVKHCLFSSAKCTNIYFYFQGEKRGCSLSRNADQRRHFLIRSLATKKEFQMQCIFLDIF